MMNSLDCHVDGGIAVGLPAREVPHLQMSCPVLEGAYNFRDLGGAGTTDGQLLRAGALFRSDALAWLTRADVEILRERLGVMCVIDLRMPDEVALDRRSPRAELDHLERLSLPIVVPSVAAPPDADEEVVLWRYFEYLRRSAPSVVAALEILSRPMARPAIVHCTSGKDRTGVVVALLLRLLGVPPNTVTADYARSEAAMPRILERLARSQGRPEIAELPSVMRAASAGVMTAFLQEFEYRFGSVEQWASDRGLSSGALARLRSGLLETRAPVNA